MSALPSRAATTLEEIVQETSLQLGPIFEQMEWAEAEIEQAQRRHPVQAALLWTTFRLMVPTQDLMPDASAVPLHPFVLSNVKPGATLLTDSWKGYLGLGGRGYAHKQVNIKRSGRTSGELLPGVHTVASHLDRWWLGTHHGAIRQRHLDAYLDEFTFRFNRRNSRARGLLFYRLMEGAASTDAVPLRALWGGTP